GLRPALERARSHVAGCDLEAVRLEDMRAPAAPARQQRNTAARVVESRIRLMVIAMSGLTGGLAQRTNVQSDERPSGLSNERPDGVAIGLRNAFGDGVGTATPTPLRTAAPASAALGSGPVRLVVYTDSVYREIEGVVYGEIAFTLF